MKGWTGNYWHVWFDGWLGVVHTEPGETKADAKKKADKQYGPRNYALGKDPGTFGRGRQE